MTLPPLPTREADTWGIHVAFEKTTPIFSVSARAGRVLVGGGKMYQLKAATQGWLNRELPDGVSMIWNVAQEPRAPWRQAVASEEGVAILLGADGSGTRIAHIRPAEEEEYVEDLAWGLVGDRSALFVRWTSGAVATLFPDTGNGDTLDLPPIAGLATDDNGAVAMICWDELRAYVSHDGQKLNFRSLEFPEDWYEKLPAEFDDPFHVAVAGQAVAFSIGWRGAFVSRDLAKEPFVKCEPLSLAGALAFEGPSPDAALYGALAGDAFSSVVRVDATGNAVRIADLLPEHGTAVPFDEIAWDPSRRSLYCVHRQAGLVTVTAPEAKRGKLALPS